MSTNVTETKAEGLSREFAVAVPAAEFEARITGRLEELAADIRLPGFRPGKVPVSLLRQRYGDALKGEILEQTINESANEIMSERGLRVAEQPKIEITSFEDGSDLEFKMAVEVMPEIEQPDFSKVKLGRLHAEPGEEQIEGTIESLAKAHATSAPIARKRKAKESDIAVIDFVGRVDGEEFVGGKAEGYHLVLGSGSFIPGFEDQVMGTSPGDSTEIKVTFPEEYGAQELAGKEAVFDVTVQELRETTPHPLDEELAKKFGAETMDQLRQSIRDEHARELKGMVRMRLKRDLLDQLAEVTDFEIPQGMVEREYVSIISQLKQQTDSAAGHDHDHDHDHDHATPDADISDEDRAEYRSIAERRVRLGLLLAEVGRMNNLQVGQEDINQAIMAEARRYPGQEQAVIEYFKNNPESVQAVTAPIFEDKVVDFILELADVEDREVSVEELVRDPDEEAEAEKTAKAKPKGKGGTKKKATGGGKKTKKDSAAADE